MGLIQFSFPFSLLSVSITSVSRNPQTRLLLVETKIYQRPRLPNLSPFCKQCSQTTWDSSGRRKTFSITTENFFVALKKLQDKNHRICEYIDKRLLLANGVARQKSLVCTRLKFTTATHTILMATFQVNMG